MATFSVTVGLTPTLLTDYKGGVARLSVINQTISRIWVDTQSNVQIGAGVPIAPFSERTFNVDHEQLWGISEPTTSLPVIQVTDTAPDAVITGTVNIDQPVLLATSLATAVSNGSSFSTGRINVSAFQSFMLSAQYISVHALDFCRIWLRWYNNPTDVLPIYARSILINGTSNQEPGTVGNNTSVITDQHYGPYVEIIFVCFRTGAGFGGSVAYSLWGTNRALSFNCLEMTDPSSLVANDIKGAGSDGILLTFDDTGIAANATGLHYMRLWAGRVIVRVRPITVAFNVNVVCMNNPNGTDTNLTAQTYATPNQENILEFVLPSRACYVTYQNISPSSVGELQVGAYAQLRS